MSTTICLHHQHGHCKYGVHCRNLHTTETCDNFPCTTTTCSKRHPKICRFFSIYGRCKFNDSCSYLHKHGDIEKTGQLEKEIENLKAEIKLLITVVDNLKDMISSLSKALNPTPVTFKSPSVSDTSLSLTPLNNVDISPPFSNVIPQLDGLQQEFVYHSSQQTSQQLLQCETCKKVFQTSEEYKKHDAFQFCCDDCGSVMQLK